jgi:carbonyl reductase 1
LDITDKTQIQALVDKIKKDQGGVDVLINNAGVNLDDDYSLETAKQTLETNYKGTLEVSGVSLPWLSICLFSQCQVTLGVGSAS